MTNKKTEYKKCLVCGAIFFLDYNGNCEECGGDLFILTKEEVKNQMTYADTFADNAGVVPRDICILLGTLKARGIRAYVTERSINLKVREGFEENETVFVEASEIEKLGEMDYIETFPFRIRIKRNFPREAEMIDAEKIEVAQK